MTDALDAESCRRKADALLRNAAAATNLAERGRLIDEAAVWHFKALGDPGRPASPSPPDPTTETLLGLEQGSPETD
jgi:hypothetical protein